MEIMVDARTLIGIMLNGPEKHYFSISNGINGIN
jgi:hypothetical protein